MLLALSVVWLIRADHDREWKQYQRQARTLELYRLERAMDRVRDDAVALAPLQQTYKAIRLGATDAWRDLPLLDFLRPSLRLRQLRPAGLHNEYHTARVPRVDRCTSCHLNTGRAAYSLDAAGRAFQDTALQAFMEARFPDASVRVGRGVRPGPG